MKTIVLATAAVLALGSAFAGDGDIPQAETFFTQLPGVIAQAPVQAPAVATAQNGQAVHVYVSQASNGTWLFQEQSHEGANS